MVEVLSHAAALAATFLVLVVMRVASCHTLYDAADGAYFNLMQSKRATSIHICARRNLLTILILCSRMGCDTNRRKDKNNRVLFQSYVAHTGHFVLVMSRFQSYTAVWAASMPEANSTCL